MDTETLNKIDAIRDQHRREVMTELEDWRINSEAKIFSNEIPLIQDNRKSYK